MIKRLPPIWIILVGALLLRWGAFYLYYFIYKTPGGIAPSPHANEVYDFLARELLSGRGFETWHFAYRPPLYPMFIAAVYGMTGSLNPLAAVFAQTILSTSISLFTYALATELETDRTTAWAAAALSALDPASVAAGLVLMAETLANFFIALALIFLARLLKAQRWRDGAACAACVALAALARPNAVYFFAVVAGLIGISETFRNVGMLTRPNWKSAVRFQTLAQAIVFASLALAGLMPWYLRNYAYQRVFTFATTSDFNLLFYKGVSVEMWASGQPAKTIEAEFAYELERRLGVAKAIETYDANTMWNYLVPADPRAYAVMRQMAIEVYAAHPLIYVALIPITIVKLLAFNGLSAELGFTRWIDLAFNGLLYGFALLGGWRAWQNKSWLWLTVTLSPIMYFLLVPAVTGGVQDTRARTNVTICFAILAAAGMRRAWVRRPESR